MSVGGGKEWRAKEAEEGKEDGREGRLAGQSQREHTSSLPPAAFLLTPLIWAHSELVLQTVNYR